MRLQKDNWCAKEFDSLNLGDKRLNRRLMDVAADLLKRPSQPIHSACIGWASAKAAYRLFDNPKLQETKLLQTHQAETIKRLQQSNESIVFAIQDTTILNYTHHPKKKGLNKINQNPGYDKPTKGIFIHNTLLVTEQGCPLGLIDQKIFQRDNKKQKDNKQRPIAEKQSYRWIEALRTTKLLSGDQMVVTLADRESDIFEFLSEAHETEAKVLIRATKDRILVNEGKEHQTLWKHMKGSLLQGNHSLHLPKRHNQPERKVNLEIRYSHVTLKPPQRYPGAQAEKLNPVPIAAVWVCERTPAADTSCIEWMLLTNMPVESKEDAVKISEWYGLRWQVECFHRILKSGCKIEDCRLETYERLKKYVRLKSVVAFRLFWLTWINRVMPEASSKMMLKQNEWRALHCYINKTRSLPNRAPSVREAVRMIAQLGGFLGRRHDKEPGMTYIWRGWEKLMFIAEFCESINEKATCG